MEQPEVEQWYVYYALTEADRIPARLKVQRLQESLMAGTGVRARLEERVDADRPLTWMEVYERVADPEGFRRSMAAALAGSGLPDELVSARHVERFKVL